MLRLSSLLQGFPPSSLLEFVFVHSHKRYSTSLYLSTSNHYYGLPTIRLQNGRRWMSVLSEPLSSLRFAINDRDIHGAKKHYKELIASQSLDMVTYRDWLALSHMLSREAPPIWYEYDEYYEELAIHCAARGFIDPLIMFMTLRFKAGHHDTIISLYDRYFVEHERATALLVQESHVNSTTSDLIADDAIPVDDNVEWKYTPQSVSRLLLLMVAAHAAQSDFNGAYRRFMESPTIVRVTILAVTAFCDDTLMGQTEVVHKVKDWVPELVLCRLVTRKGSIDRYLTSLAGDHNIKMLEKLYRRIIEHSDDPDKILCVVQSEQKPEKLDRSKRLVVPEDVWSSFIKAFFRCNRLDLIGILWKDIRTRGLIPNLYVRNTLLEGFGGRPGQLDKAIAVWKDMLNAGIEPNSISYGAMIQAYFRNRRSTEAIVLFDQFRQNAKANPQDERAIRVQSLLRLYNIVLHGLLTNKLYLKAKMLLEDIDKHGPKPDITTYNIFLRFHGRTGDLQAVGHVLQRMKELDIDPDVYSFTTVLTALYSIGKQDAHTQLLNIMMSMDLRPNVATYSAIINSLVREGGQTNLQNAISLLSHMENDADKASRPNEITYTSLLGGIQRDRSLTSDEVKSYTGNILQRMRRNGILPTRTTYHCLIKASLENPEERGLQLGLRYHKEMESRGIVETDKTWYIILSSLLRRGNVEKAVDIVNDMRRKGHQPDEVLSKVVDSVQTYRQHDALYALF